ncbi:MAG: galactose-1-phosphate uridyl transferase [Candelaria pacifica]|nr:MAG: galactose-1-phosphate uridyl transferase [Candelaria pacifica]
MRVLGYRGQEEAASKTELPAHDSSCYLCPGNKRAGEDINPEYKATFVFVNDYSAVKEDQADYQPEELDGGLSSRLLRAEAVTGKCYVVTFSPQHNLTLADLSRSDILTIINQWTELYTAHLSPSSPLAAIAGATRLPPRNHAYGVSRPNAQYRYMQIFENKGAAMGCSNPHPHGQIWVTSSLPEEPSLELEQLQNYRREQGGAHLLEDYAKLESQKQERVVFENSAFLALCPWWATWPFEVMIVSKAHRRALVDFDDGESSMLAEAIAGVTRRYDNLFETQFPYSE